MKQAEAAAPMSIDVEHYAIGLLAWGTEYQRNKPRRKFAATGYRKLKGAGDLFSIWVVMPGLDSAGMEIGSAEIHALVGTMAERLPKPGEMLVITDGVAPIAEFTCQTMSN